MIKSVSEDLKPEERAEEFLKIITKYVAIMLAPIYEKTGGRDGYACGQLNPLKANDAQAMLDMARRI